MTSTDWYILVLSMLPVTELRATIPVAISLGILPWKAYILAVVGNMLPVLPILFLLSPLEQLLRKYFPRLDRYLQWLLQKTRRKEAQVKKYGTLGLAIFVAIPLPGTGAWTGATLAWLLGLSVRTAFFSIGIGVLLAGIIVTLLSLGVIKAVYITDLSFVLGVLLLLAFFCVWWKKKRKNNLG